jgi:hypothetical protein
MGRFAAHFFCNFHLSGLLGNEFFCMALKFYPVATILGL